MNTNFRPLFLFAGSLLLMSCSGGGPGVADNGGMGGTGVSMGVMTKGSVIVNGVSYDDTSANISIDDTPKTAAHLQDGMVVSVNGTIDTSGRNGSAQTVKAVIEVRGPVTSKDATANPQRFVVLGQTVMVDDLTVYSNITFGAIANDMLVEVHGLRDAAGNIRATRVEGSENPVTVQNSITGMTNPSVDEIRGIVSEITLTTFKIGDQVVAISPGVIVPIGATINNGTLVEVHCNRPCLNGVNHFVASRIEVEDGSNRPGNGQRFEVEGLISGFGVVQGQFFVAGVPVTIGSAVTFRGGISTDLANNIKVEAEGLWNGTRLIASKIEFKRSVVRLQGIVLANPTPTLNTFTLQIGDPLVARNITIERDGFTTDAVPTPGPNCVQIRGQKKAVSGLVVVAGEITSSCSSSNDHLIQAPVENEAGFTLTLLGFPIDVGNPTDRSNPGDTGYKNIDDLPMERAAFFSAVVPGDSLVVPPVAGTLVKIRFDTPGTTVNEVELED